MVEDSPAIHEVVRRVLQNLDYEVIVTENAQDGLSCAARGAPDLAILDINLPDFNGIELLRRIRQELLIDCAVLIITGQGSVASAVKAMKLGASDYLKRPFDAEDLKTAVLGIVGPSERKSTGSVPGERGHVELVGQVAGMKAIFKLIQRVAQSDATVVIYGENGTGKELAARVIHETGSRSNEPFIPVDCSALAPGTVESELFGHVKGAFPGADADREGFLVMARKGTVFLDEIFELSLGVQAMLLCMLQEKAVHPPGSKEVKELGARVVASSNQDLMEAVREGGFREDLFYMLHIVPIHMPPLRERAEDIPLLAEHFLSKHASDACTARSISPEVVEALPRLDWPGNVSQLENVIRRAIALCDKSEIKLKHLPVESLSQGDDNVSSETGSRPKGLMDEAERAAILKALELAGGNKRRTARILGISKITLYAKLKKYGIEQ